LVDIFCDDVIFSAQQGAEKRTIFEEALAKYTINQSKMLRYADRRPKKEELNQFVKSFSNFWQQLKIKPFYRMINLNEISSEWLTQVSKQHHNADKILAEKVIRALLLLEGLAKQKLTYVFKGGTALMLHFNSTKRLSTKITITKTLR
jgi:hypothetical protein